MSGVQTLEQRLAELLKLREAVRAEIRRVARAINEQPRTRRRGGVPPCGTDAGYQYHRRLGEPKDEACLLAHNEAERIRAIVRAERRAS